MSDKSYTYPNITVNFDSTSTESSQFEVSTKQKWLYPEKNTLNFELFVPEGNHFYLNKKDTYGNASGFFLLSTGLEYYFSNKYYINSDTGLVTDFPIPFPASLGYDGEFHSHSAFYTDFQLGRAYKRLHYDVNIPEPFIKLEIQIFQIV